LTFVIITQRECLWCDEAKRMLTERGLDYIEEPLGDKQWIKTLLIKAGLKTVPQVFNSKGDLIGGAEELSAYLS
jgi:glutaredoxin